MKDSQNEYAKKLNDNVSEVCKEKKMSKTKVLVDSGLNKSYLTNAVKNGNVPGIDTVTKIANTLGVPVLRIIPDEKNNLTEQELRKVINERIDLMNADEMMKLKEIIDSYNQK